jgi:hypothetical protein
MHEANVVSVLDNVLSRLSNVRQEGDGYRSSCPLPRHGKGRGDRNPSLSIGVDREGNILLHCFANCGSESIVEALGLSMADLFASRNGHGGKESCTSHKTRPTDQPCTIENYAEYVKLPLEFL